MVSIELTDLQSEIERRIAKNAESDLIVLRVGGQVVGAVRYLGSAVRRDGGLNEKVTTVGPEFFEEMSDDLVDLVHGAKP